MNIGIAIVVSGLLVELLAGLILAAEAIGLDRFENWARSLMTWNEQIKLRRFDDPKSKVSYQRIINAVSSGLGAFLGILTAGYAESYLGRQPWWIVMLFLTIGCVVGVFVVPFFVRLFCLGLVIMLRKIEGVTQTRAAGAFGFGVLSLGITMQAMGTLIDVFIRH